MIQKTLFDAPQNSPANPTQSPVSSRQRKQSQSWAAIKNSLFGRCDFFRKQRLTKSPLTLFCSVVEAQKHIAREHWN